MLHNLRKNCIILDLDHTLIHAVIKNDKTKYFIDNAFNQDKFRIRLSNEEFVVYRRPYLDQFLEFCFSKYKYVIIWSAGTENYVNKILRIILSREQKPYKVITRDTFDTKKKDIENILDDPNISVFRLMFVDDSPRRIRNLDNAFIIRSVPYHISHERVQNDNYLYCLINYLS